MNDTVWTTLIISLVAMMSPLTLAYLTNRHRRQEKIDDYKRQDEVAAKAAEAAKLLLAANERVVEAAKITNEKLLVIHTLVNSNMTAAIQSELDATLRELAMMIEVVALKKAAGHEPTAETIAAIEATQAKISELKSKLNDRAKQNEIAEQQETDQTRRKQRLSYGWRPRYAR